MKTSIGLSLLLLTFSALAAGCSSTTEPQPAAVKLPGIGSSYTFQQTSRDETGATISDSTSTYTIRDTGATYAGKAHVVIVTNEAQDSSCFYYTATGLTYHRSMIPIYQTISLPELWVAVDTTNRTERTLDTRRDTVTASGVDLYFNTTETYMPQSDSSVALAGKTYRVFRWKTRTTVEVTVSITGQKNTTVVTNDHAFSDAIGFYTLEAQTTHSDSQQSPVPNGTETSVLVSFVRK